MRYSETKSESAPHPSHVVARAPVRISFAGGGTDLAAYYLEHGGFVISAAITRYCYVVAREPADRGIHLNSADYRSWHSFPAGSLPNIEEPLVLPKAAIERFATESLKERGVDLFLAAEVPPGTGLGSSSAMATALALALGVYSGERLSKTDAAETACWMEIERLGMPIGKQDQYASAFGGLNTIEFGREGVRVCPLPIKREVSEALSTRLLLFASGEQRNSADILRQQREDTRTKPFVSESLHRLKALAQKMARVLLDGELDEFGRLLHEGWQEKKRLSDKVSNPAIDRWYHTAHEAGALGGKIAGAGGGGFLMLYCPPERQERVRERMVEMGLNELSFDFDWEGAQVLIPGKAPDQYFRANGSAPLYAKNGKRKESYSHAR